MSLERMGRCARLAWDHAVESHRTAQVTRPAVTTGHILLGVLKETDCAGGLILGKIPLDLKLALGVTEFMLLHSRPRPDADLGTGRGAPSRPATRRSPATRTRPP